MEVEIKDQLEALFLLWYILCSTNSKTKKGGHIRFLQGDTSTRKSSMKKKLNKFNVPLFLMQSDQYK